MVGTMRCDSEKDGQLGLIDISCLLQKEKPISKPNLSPDRGLQLILVKPKSLVVAGHQTPFYESYRFCKSVYGKCEEVCEI